MMLTIRPAQVACALLLAAFVGGCSSAPQLQDIPASQAPWLNGRSTTADGNVLHIAFLRPSSSELNVHQVDYKVYDGNLYIWPVTESHSFVPCVFDLNTTPLKLQSPWTQHVYWVSEVDWDGPVEHACHPGPLGQYVKRVKANVTPATTQP